jgi:hypothetical protein
MIIDMIAKGRKSAVLELRNIKEGFAERKKVILDLQTL